MGQNSALKKKKLIVSSWHKVWNKPISEFKSVWAVREGKNSCTHLPLDFKC